MGEEQQQNKITEQQQKDLQDLQNIGEEAGKKAAEDIQKLTEEPKNITSVQDKNLQSNNISYGGGSLLSVVSMFGVTLIIALILMLLSKKKRIKGYFKSVIKLICYVCIGNIIYLFIPKALGAYVLFVIGGNIIYYFFKQKVNVTNKEELPSDEEKPGVVLGADKGKLIVKECKTPGNVLVVGAPGKGKSQCLSIPTLLNWKGSALVIDIKRELYAYTNNVQSKKGKVIVFDPEQNGHAYNPIKECDTVDSCQFLARSLIPTPKGAEPFWTGNAQNILAAACFEGNKEGKTLPEISERILLTEPEVLVQELTNSKYKEAQLLASSVKGTPDKTLGGIFTELKNAIIIFATDENIKRALSNSEWSAETLEEGATIYMRVSERQIETYKKVWNLIIVQVLRHLNSRGEHQDPPILLLLDELPRLGKVEGYTDSLGTLRSKDVTIFSAAQSLAQFQLHYGKEATRIIMDTHTYKVCLSASDDETQQVFSKLAGKYERVKESTNTNWSPGNFVPGQGKSKFTQWEERFRPETLAYIDRPIFFPPDKEAFQIDKAFWMNIPGLVNLQKESGGPVTFIVDEDFKTRSEFKRGNISVETIKDIQYKNNKLEYEEAQKIYKQSYEGSIIDDEDENNNENGVEETNNLGHIELFEKWKIR